MNSTQAAQNMAVFKVDPTLLGLPPAAPAAAAAVDAGAAPPQAAPSMPAVPVKPAQPSSANAPPAAPVEDLPRRSASVAPAASAARPRPGDAEAPPPAGSSADRKNATVYVVADDIQGKTGVDVVAKGAVDLRKADNRLLADQVTYHEVEDQVEAEGNVRLTREGDRIDGPRMKLKIGDSVGTFDKPSYEIAGSTTPAKPGKPAKTVPPGRGTADRIDFDGPDRYRLTNATYSTCVPSASGLDWYARVSDMSLDYQTSDAEAHDATVLFKGVPVLYSPWLSFSLNRERKSGFLTPTFGSSTLSGAELSVPYYINIAPDMDATITPRAMTRRGVQLRGEFRYLGRDYNGEIGGEYLPNDHVSNTNRSALSVHHIQNFREFLPGLSGTLDINRVSDGTYFTDLSSRLTNIAQTNLLRQGQLAYGGGWWSSSLLVQRYQTLQDPAQPPVGHPYERLPQLAVNATRPDLPMGLWADFRGIYTKFGNPDSSRVTGNRAVLYPSLSYPFQTAAVYITPKIGVHSTRYDLDNPAIGTPRQLTRNVPIFSVDSGVTFERDMDWFGRAMLQTLEPRLYYLRTPFRDQSALDNPLAPVNFDSGLADFNFAQIFSENIYSGDDRIADANQLTAAVTSRLINPNTGAELGKVMVGERYYFTDQHVTLLGVAPRSYRNSDFLAGATAQVSPSVHLDSALQYNGRDSQMERFNLGGRYQPETGKVLNAGYRYTRTQLDQFDVSGQWPLMVPGWSAVGRYNFSMKDHRTLESLAGVEYNESCWSARFVVHHLATRANSSSTAFFFQLELNGFSSLGSNPFDVLKRNVPGYGGTGSPITDQLFND